MSRAAKQPRKKPPRPEELIANGAQRVTRALKRKRREYVAPSTPEEAIERAWATWNLQTSEHTRAARVDDLRQFGRWLTLEEEPRETLDKRAAFELPKGGPVPCRERAQEWIASMQEDGLAAPTIARRATTLRSWLRHLGDYGLNWQVRLKTAKFDPYNRAQGPEAATVERVLRELEEPAQTGAKAARDRALILLLYDHALRRMSAVGLDVEHVDLRKQTVRVRVKNRHDLILRTLTTRATEALEAWLEHRGTKPGPVFCPLRPVAKRDGPNLDVTQRLHPSTISQITTARGLGPSHGLRHAAATELRRRDASPWLIQALLGHRNIQTTQVYLDETGDEAGRASRVLAGEEGIDE